MTTEPQNTTDPPSPATGRPIMIARLVICCALFGGVLVFGIFAFESLMNARSGEPISSEFGKRDGVPTAEVKSLPPGNFIQALAQPDPNQFVPILRDNPHPGKIAPFLGAPPTGQPPYSQPNTDREVWEFCAYRTLEPNHPDDAFEHYNRQAISRGLTLERKGPTSDKLPNGMKAAWSDGKQTLELTTWPTRGGETRIDPPFNKPRGPLDWVVKYSYPVGTEPYPAK